MQSSHSQTKSYKSYGESIFYQNNEEVKILNIEQKFENPLNKMELLSKAKPSKDPLHYKMSAESQLYERHFCRCRLCVAKDDIKLPLKQHKNYADTFFKNFQHEEGAEASQAKPEDKNFNFILQSLQQAKCFIATLKINIPDTICFNDKKAIMIIEGSKVLKNSIVDMSYSIKRIMESNILKNEIDSH